MSMISALKKDEELVREMDSFGMSTDGFQLWWLGQSGFLLQWRGRRILIDPYLSDSLTKKYETTDKPHVRMSERVVDPQLLKNIAIVTSSHNHTDHLDAETLSPVIRNNPDIRFIIPEANRFFVAERLECELEFPIGMSDGTTISFEEFRFTGLPAKHNDIERDENGNCCYMGYVISFGKYNVYHSGDTLWFDEMVELIKPYNVDVALLPINGNLPGRRVAGNLTGAEAAKLGKLVNAKCVIPCHYDMFAFNTADVSEFVAAANKEGQPYKVLKGGERFDSDMLV